MSFLHDGRSDPLPDTGHSIRFTDPSDNSLLPYAIDPPLYERTHTLKTGTSRGRQHDSLLEGTDTAHTLTADELIDLLRNR